MQVPAEERRGARSPERPGPRLPQSPEWTSPAGPAHRMPAWSPQHGEDGLWLFKLLSGLCFVKYSRPGA